MVVIHANIIQQRDFDIIEIERLKTDTLSLGADYIPVDAKFCPKRTPVLAESGQHFLSKTDINSC